MVKIRTVLTALILTVTVNFGDADQQKLDDCVCPAFKRQICTLGISGDVVKHDNFCAAKCHATLNKQPLGVGPRSSSCNKFEGGSGENNAPHPGVHGNYQSDNYHKGHGKNVTDDKWFQEVAKEAKLWAKVNQLMTEFIYLSNGGGPRCVCPAIEREVCRYTPSGAIVKSDNACMLMCEKTSAQAWSPVTYIGVPCNPPTYNYGKGTVVDEEVELNEWFKYMEKEIKFYHKVSEAMNGFFLENKTPETKLSSLPSTYKNEKTGRSDSSKPQNNAILVFSFFFMVYTNLQTMFEH